MDDKTKTELEAAAFRRLVQHLRRAVGAWTFARQRAASAPASRSARSAAAKATSASTPLGYGVPER